MQGRYLRVRRHSDEIRNREGGGRPPLLLAKLVGAAAAVGLSLALVIAGSAWFRSRPTQASRDGASSQAGPDTGLSTEGSRAYESLTPGAPPEIVELAPNRFRGPGGKVVVVPEGWRFEAGSSSELWAVLTPEHDDSGIPRIGVGLIAVPGLDPSDAAFTVDHFLDELLPEITMTQEPVDGGILSKGSGRLEGRDVVQVRRLYPVAQGVVVVWGMFPKGFRSPATLVSSILQN